MARDTSIGTLSVGLELDAGEFNRDVAAAQGELKRAAQDLQSAAQEVEAAPLADVTEDFGEASEAAGRFGDTAGAVLDTLAAVAREVDGVVEGTRRHATAQEDVADAATEATEATAAHVEVVEEATAANNDFDVSLTLVSTTLLKYVKDAAGAATRTSAFRAVLAAVANPATAVVAALGAVVLAVRELDQALDETAERLASDGLLGDVDARLEEVEGAYQLSSAAAAVYTQRLEEQTAEAKAAEVASAEFFARLSPFGDLFDSLTASGDEFKAKVFEIGVVIYDTLAATNAWLPALEEVDAAAVDLLADVERLLPGRVEALARASTAKLADVLIAQGSDVAEKWARGFNHIMTQEMGDVERLQWLKALNESLDAVLKPPPEAERFKPAIIAASLRDLQGLSQFFEDEEGRWQLRLSAYSQAFSDLATTNQVFASTVAEAGLSAAGLGDELDAVVVSMEGLDLSPLADANRALATYERTVEQVDAAWGRVGSTATDVLEAMVTGAGDARAVLASLAEVFFDLLGAGLGGLLGGQGFGAGIADFFGFPGRAVGGPVWAGQPVVVGEDGPELLVPQTGGTVVPGVGVGGVSVTLNVAAGVDAPTFDRLLQRRLPDILRTVESGLRRG